MNFMKTLFKTTVNRIKVKLTNKLASKSNQFAGIVEFEKLSCKNYIFLNPSFESYSEKKSPSKDRIFKYWLFTALHVLNTIRYAVLLFFNDNWLLAIQGEFIYKIYKIRLTTGLMMCAGIGTSILPLMHGYYEMRSKFHCLDLLYHLSHKSSEYRLETNNEMKYSMIAFLLFRTFLRQQVKTLTIVAVIVFTYYSVMAYLDEEVEHNIVCLLINLVMTIIWVRQTFLLGLSEALLLCLSSLYLILRFSEILIKLKRGIKEKRAFLIFLSIFRHKQISDLTHDLNDYISYVIGFVYTNGSIIIGVLSYAIFDQSVDLLIRIICILFLIIVCLICYMVNIMSASISTANKSIAKQLYPIFIGKQFKNLRLKMKVESFIARLNNVFVGFYCFNMFKFTKKAFYEFFFTLTSVYFMIFRINND